MSSNIEMLTAAHDACIRNENAVRSSKLCGCFCCCLTFLPAEIREWVDEPQGGRSALCPKCHIDSVLGDSSGFPLDKEFLTVMSDYWFGAAGETSPPSNTRVQTDRATRGR